MQEVLARSWREANTSEVINPLAIAYILRKSRNEGVIVMSRAALIWVSLVVLGSVVPSNAAQTADANLFQDVKAAVIAQLRDPDSARFGKLERRTRPNFEGEPVDVVCGEVNSRNGYGGYTGMSGFIYLIAQRKAYFAGGSDFWGRLGSDLYSLYCAPDLSSHTMP